MAKVLKVTKLNGQVTSYKIAITEVESLVNRYKGLADKKKDTPQLQK